VEELVSAVATVVIRIAAAVAAASPVLGEAAA